LVEKKFISSDETVPKECEALEVWINVSWLHPIQLHLINNYRLQCSGRIPADLSGDCFGHVMNTTTTALERLLIERNIHGPCWLEIRNPGLTQLSQ
jgi:DNA polymerase alpha subunit A